MMLIGDPWDRFFYPFLTHMIDSYILTWVKTVEILIWYARNSHLTLRSSVRKKSIGATVNAAAENFTFVLFGAPVKQINQHSASQINTNPLADNSKNVQISKAVNTNL